MSESIQYWATTNAGNANSDPAISSSDTQAPNTVATNIRSIMTALAKARLDIFGGGLTAGGTPNALTVTTNQVLVSAQLTGGAALMVKAASTNTSTTVTFAPDGLTPAPIKRADGSALAVGSIQAGMFLFLIYDSGTSSWWCLNIPPVPVGASLGSSLASFSANKNGASQSGVASSTWTLVTFGTASWNTGSYYNTGTSTWTPPAGNVLISAVVAMISQVDGTSLQVGLYKNGSLYQRGNQIISGASGIEMAASGSWIAQASGSDAFTIEVFQTDSIARILEGSATATWFSGSMI